MGNVTPFTIADFPLKRNTMQLTTSSTSANLPRGILASIGSALAGSDHPTCNHGFQSYFYMLVKLSTLAIAVIVTVGLTAFTLICLGPNSKAATL